MHPDPNPGTRPQCTERGPYHRISAVGAPNGAKYKMMSPAKLPISRSPCLTVPPGISPGALLESPVFLNNIKAEPSPTTGTFSFHSVNQSCSPRGAFRNFEHNDGSSGAFEFKPHIQTSSRSCLSSTGHLTSVNPSQQQQESYRQVGTQSQTQTLESSQLVQPDITSRYSHELTPPVTASDSPIETSPSGANVSDEVTPDELRQTKDSDNVMHVLQCDNNGSSPSAIGEKSAEDGYNWRKYGQKHVKGCEYPRSYYKCTHPNCQMKKQLERSQNGQITEIIYKGRHNHPKPEPSLRVAVGTILSGQVDERSGRSAEVLWQSGEKLSNAQHLDPNGTTESSPVSPSDDDAEVGVGGSHRNGDDVADDDDPEAKRRKIDNATFDATQMGKTNREPRVVVQTISEVDIMDDGYRWRKYGQKVVKGNPNPRSYYKCTNASCSVRKHVERASHDPKAVITTYEGKHNHDVPAANNSSHDTAAAISSNGGSTHSIHMPTALGARSKLDSIPGSHCYNRPAETSMVSLDLGVGISADHYSCAAATEKLQQAPGIGHTQTHEMHQFPASGGNKAVVQATPLSVFYGGPGNGLFGHQDGNADGFSFTTPVNHASQQYYPTSGNLVMGP